LENQVLVLKELIGSLSSNKTEHAIITVSKAAPVIQDIVNNVDQMVNVENKQSSLTFYHAVIVFSSLSNETYNKVFLYKEGCN
jgi:hypothetical protein